MSAIAILSFLVGAVLGRSLRVFVLLPAIASGLSLVAAFALETGASTTSSLLAAALVALGLQLGYLAGVLFKHMIAGAKASQPRVNASAVARSNP